MLLNVLALAPVWRHAHAICINSHIINDKVMQVGEMLLILDNRLLHNSAVRVPLSVTSRGVLPDCPRLVLVAMYTGKVTGTIAVVN